jgi:hypothetical protein
MWSCLNGSACNLPDLSNATPVEVRPELLSRHRVAWIEPLLGRKVHKDGKFGDRFDPRMVEGRTRAHVQEAQRIVSGSSSSPAASHSLFGTFV